MLRSAERFRCHACGHTHAQPAPEIALFGSDVGKLNNTIAPVETKVEEYCFLDELDNVVLEVLLSFCDSETQVKISHVSLLGDSKALNMTLAVTLH